MVIATAMAKKSDRRSEETAPKKEKRAALLAV
jgi:hypothetical protein